jgi:hypothetical protein
MRRKNWSNKKHGKNFKGTYQKHNGERVLNLSNGKKNLTFESHQAAKDAGWKAE